MHRLWHADTSSPEVRELLLAASLGIYDATNDDDEDIRDAASEAATKAIYGKLYRPGMVDLFPVAASQSLSKHLARQYGDSQQLCRAALVRLLGISDEQLLSTKTVAEIVSESRQEDAVLFAQERQNLFIDDTREAVIWSRVLIKLNSTAIPRDLAHWMADWVMRGLETLKHIASFEKDGSLGWTSRREVFVVGMRVIYAAEVLLEWRMRTKKVTVRGSVIRRALIDLVDVGEKANLHPLWMERAQTVLARYVIQQIRCASEKITAIGGDTV